MAKATKKSHEAGTSEEPSTSRAKPKKGDQTSRQVRTKTTGKTGGHSSSRAGGKMQKPIKKGKRPLPPSPKRKPSEKTNIAVKKLKKSRGKPAFGHYHRLMDELIASEPEQDPGSLENISDPGREPRSLESTSDPVQEPRSLESSTTSTCDLESQ